MNEIKLHRLPYVSGHHAWYASTQWQAVAVLCSDAVDKYVRVPANVNDIVLVFSSKRHTDSFKVKVRNLRTINPYEVCGTNRSELYRSMDIIIQKQLRKGNQYFRVEYDV